VSCYKSLFRSVYNLQRPPQIPPKPALTRIVIVPDPNPACEAVTLSHHDQGGLRGSEGWDTEPGTCGIFAYDTRKTGTDTAVGSRLILWIVAGGRDLANQHI
jgi:hypothetical protein